MNSLEDLSDAERREVEDQAFRDANEARRRYDIEFWNGEHHDDALCVGCDYPASLCSCRDGFKVPVPDEGKEPPEPDGEAWRGRQHDDFERGEMARIQHERMR